MSMATEKYPAASVHVKERWIEITGDYVSDPSGYWPEGISLDDHLEIKDPGDTSGIHGDEARYIPEFGVTLVRNESKLTTVIDNNGTERPELRRAVEAVTADD